MTDRIVGPDVQGLDVASATLTAGVNTTATSSATATVLMTAGPAYFPGGNYDVYFFSPVLTKGTTNLDLELWVDGAFSQTITGHLTANVAIPGFHWIGRLSLADGIHILTVRGFVDAGTGTLGAGTGATGQSPNAVLLARRA